MRIIRNLPKLRPKLRQTKINEFFNTVPELTKSINEIKIDYEESVKYKPNIYLLRFDGASKGNPGKAGAGAVLYLNQNEIWNGSKYIGDKFTCNYAEYSGIIIGLEEALRKDIKDLYVEGDSQLVINQLKGTFKVKSHNLIDLYTKAKYLSNQFNSINFKHIYRNENARADELANLLIKK